VVDVILPGALAKVQQPRGKLGNTFCNVLESVWDDVPNTDGIAGGVMTDNAGVW
jgi:hypothetical protein